MVPGETGAVSLGRQLTLEYYDCDAAILADAGVMERLFLEAAHRSGATVVGSNFHRFEPQGVSGVVIICESHFAVHAWPEHDYAAVDLFTCGDSIDFDVAAKVIAAGLKSQNYLASSFMNRGIVGNNGVERIVPLVENAEQRFALSWRQRFETTQAAAISAAIDLYECADHCFEAEFVSSFCHDLVRQTGLQDDPKRAVKLRTIDERELGFQLHFSNGRLGGIADGKHRTLYLDLFALAYFDPREAAELAVRAWSGRYYRLQPHIRQ